MKTCVKRGLTTGVAFLAAALGLCAPEVRSVGSFQVVVFDLTKGTYAPRVVLEERLVSVRELLGPEPPAAAITGTFFAWENGRPVGEVVIDGDVVADGARGSAIGVDWYGRVHIFDTEVRGWQDWFPYRYGLRAGVRIVREGVVDPKPWTQGFRDRGIWGSAARTAVGTTPGGKLVMMATRSSVTLSTLGRQMTALGVTNAVALDGGGSTMLYAKDRYLISTSRRLNNLFIVEEKSPLDDKFRAHLQRLARNQTDGVANGVSGTGAANP